MGVILDDSRPYLVSYAYRSLQYASVLLGPEHFFRGMGSGAQRLRPESPSLITRKMASGAPVMFASESNRGRSFRQASIWFSQKDLVRGAIRTNAAQLLDVLSHVCSTSPCLELKAAVDRYQPLVLLYPMPATKEIVMKTSMPIVKAV